MNQYIITEELLIEIGSPLTDPGRIIDIKETVRSTPYNPHAEQEKVLQNITDYANTIVNENFRNSLLHRIEELRQEGKDSVCMRGLEKCSKDCDDCPDTYTCSESSK